jgi:hypothetical protein
MGRVRVKDFYALGRALNALGRDVEKGAEMALWKAARWGVGHARSVAAATDPRPKAVGDYERGFRAERIKGGGRLYNNAPHARFVERGRKPGKGPPLEAIVEWVMVKGIVRRSRMKAKSKFQEARSVAFAVQRKIAKKGIKGRYVLDRAMPAVRRKAKANLAAMIAKIAARPPKT